jgi:putative ABC transport system permease protein
VSTLPLSEGLDYSQPFSIVDDPTQPGQERRAYFRHASPAVFQTLDTPLEEGRPLEATDRVDAPGAVIVNEALARRFFPGEDPVGHRLTGLSYRWGPLGAVLIDEAEIVGVVKDMPYDGIREPAQPAFYFSFRQGPMRRMTVLVRTDGDPLALVDGARAALAEVNPQVAMSRVRTMNDVVGEAMARDRFSTLLLVAFGVMALILAAVGVYGVLAYAVAQRTAELGIRMALGASASDVRRMVLKEGGSVAGLGLILGLGAALVLAGFLSTQLYGVGPRDPVVYGIVTSVLAAVAVAASLVPALRATRVDPVTAMRGE